MAIPVQVVIDCADPDALAHFWAEAIGYKLEDPPPGFASWEDWLRQMNIPEEDWNMASAIVDRSGVGPRIYFQRVPEPKTVKDRVHLDVNGAGRPDAVADRLVGLGATKVGVQEEYGSYHVDMKDPEGNEFCVTRVDLGTPLQVTIDCTEPHRVATFWATAIGYVVEPPPAGYDSWAAFLASRGMPEAEASKESSVVDPDGKGPRLFFQQVPEPKTVKNRLHLDVNVGGPRGTPLDDRKVSVGAAVERLAGEGATKLYQQEEHGEFHVTVQDPEGNEFCLQ